VGHELSLISLRRTLLLLTRSGMLFRYYSSLISLRITKTVANACAQHAFIPSKYILYVDIQDMCNFWKMRPTVSNIFWINDMKRFQTLVIPATFSPGFGNVHGCGTEHVVRVVVHAWDTQCFGEKHKGNCRVAEEYNVSCKNGNANKHERNGTIKKAENSGGHGCNQRRIQPGSFRGSISVIFGSQNS